MASLMQINMELNNNKFPQERTPPSAPIAGRPTPPRGINQHPEAPGVVKNDANVILMAVVVPRQPPNPTWLERVPAVGQF